MEHARQAGPKPPAHWIAGMIAAIALAVVGSARGADARYVGYAYGLDSGELIYREFHAETVTGEGDVRLETTYEDAAGRTIARREVRFRGRAPDPRPDFQMMDFRLGYEEGVARRDAGYRVFKRDEGKLVEKLLEPRDRPLVIDAGFDRFVQEQWERLQAGEFARFDFVNCDRLSLIGLRLSKRGTRGTEYGPVTDLELEPNNWLIRLLVDSIVLTYRNEDRSLLEYRGISNVKKLDGSNHVVRIHFPPEERSAGLTALAAGASR